ncbi:acyl-CoA N-acyltransferase [Hypoxylon sp. NC1633]|nr:acyl-CoA N-acyltransferase [Hypoxylon sp. NC1633]
MVLPFLIPSSLSPAFSMSYGTAADVDAITELYYDSFQADPRNCFWWAPEKEAMIEWMTRRVLRKMGDPSVRHYKVTDRQSGDLVAFTRWDIPQGHEAMFGEWTGDNSDAVDEFQTVIKGEDAANMYQTKEDLPVASSAPVEATTDTIDCPEGSQPELCQGFFDKLGDMSEKHDAKTMLGLSLLCTSTKYQRRGAAKALMLPMLHLADVQGLKVYLEATPHGKPLYERLGFREVDQLTFDLKEITGKSEEVYKITIMVREPMLM